MGYRSEWRSDCTAQTRRRVLRSWGFKLMSFRPLHDRLLVKRIEEHEQAKGGIVIPDTAKEKPQQGEVVAVGTGRRLKDGTIIPLDLRVGDRIIFGKYAGNEVILEGEEVLILREDEVLAVQDQAAKERQAA